jgi:hypothetical protein
VAVHARGHNWQVDDSWHPRCPPPTGLVLPVRRLGPDRSGPSPGVLRGGAWVQVAQGWHVPAGTPRTPEQRTFEVAVRLREASLITGWAALRLAGASYFEGLAEDRRMPLPVPVLLPHHARLRGPQVRVERTRLPLPAAVWQSGVRCVPGELALLHELRRAATPRHAGVMVDMALAAGVVDLSRLRQAASDQRRLPAGAAYALDRACGECRSPRESDMLQIWESVAGFPRPLMNREVRDLSGRLLAVVDLLDVEAGVCGEFNGAAHRSAARQSRDEKRHAALRGVGLETFAVVGSDSERVQLERMAAARARAGWAAPHQRRWQVGAFVPAPALVVRDEEEVARDRIMLAHYAELESRRRGEPPGRPGA